MKKNRLLELAAGAHPELLDVLRKMEHPAYKEWEDRGYPVGNAGIIIRGLEDKFEILPYTQLG